MSIAVKFRSPDPVVRPGVQYAALPFRLSATVEVLLVTSRETQRWVIPKGWPMKGKKAHAAAAREAFEEAGAQGRIARAPIGAYRYVKVLKNGAPLVCRVDVFPMLVQRQRKRWPERQQRTAHWFTASQAAEAVREPELQAIILRLDAAGRELARQIVAEHEVRKARGRPAPPRVAKPG
jgi:8-oxo-dGTP pyrophosphatase MutT (NUDIX family)